MYIDLKIHIPFYGIAKYSFRVFSTLFFNLFFYQETRRPKQRRQMVDWIEGNNSPRLLLMSRGQTIICLKSWNYV